MPVSIAHNEPAWIERVDSLLKIDLAGHGLDDTVELFPVKALGNRTYELCCVPFFTYGYSLADVIEADENRSVGSIVARGGRLVIRVAIDSQDHLFRLHGSVLEVIKKHNLLSEWHNVAYCSIDVPNSLLAEVVVRDLLPLQPQGVYFESCGSSGNQPAHANAPFARD